MKSKLEVPSGESTVLLHTCCAPCSSAIIECLLDNGVTPVIYYCNPNIYPAEEYLIRKDECSRYAEALGLEIVDADYDHDAWLEAMAGFEGEPERGGRCLRCFGLRLYRTACYARERGIRVITTTLASSRWKSLEQIDRAGRWACAKASSLMQDLQACSVADRDAGQDAAQDISTDVIWWDRNWRKGGLQERRLQIINEYGFYNQQYCGCEFSMRKDLL